jgi:putative hydrolase of the HAD superfamily
VPVAGGCATAGRRTCDRALTETIVRFWTERLENSNDSHWLPSADQRITDMPRILGDEESERSLRTRGAIAQLEEQLAREPFSRQGMQDLVLSNRSYSADLVGDAGLALCQGLPGWLARSSAGWAWSERASRRTLGVLPDPSAAQSQHHAPCKTARKCSSSSSTAGQRATPPRRRPEDAVGVALQGILFDLDGTLFAREAAFWLWLREEARHAPQSATGLDWAQVVRLDQRGRGPKPRLLEYLALALSWPERSLEARLQRLRQGILGQARADPRLLALLGRLRRSYRLGVVTNGSSQAQRGKLSGLQIETFFDPIIVSEEVGHRKPEFAIFRLAARGWPLAHAEVLFVGDDAILDIGGAKGAGMQTLQVLAEPIPPGQSCPPAAFAAGLAHEQERPDDTPSIGSVLEIEDWLEQGSAG